MSRNKKFTRSKKLKLNRSRKGGFWRRFFGITTNPNPDSNNNSNNKSWFRKKTKTIEELEDIYKKCAEKCSKIKYELLAGKKKELSDVKNEKRRNEDILKFFDKDSNSSIAAQENIDKYELKIKELERDIASIQQNEGGI
jgi:hypothetical protein